MQEENYLSYDFPDRLLALIKSRGLKQKEFAHAVNITETTISRYIKGQREPASRELKQMAIFFDVSMDYLWRGEDYNTAINSSNEKLEPNTPTKEFTMDAEYWKERALKAEYDLDIIRSIISPSNNKVMQNSSSQKTG